MKAAADPGDGLPRRTDCELELVLHRPTITRLHDSCWSRFAGPSWWGAEGLLGTEDRLGSARPFASCASITHHFDRAWNIRERDPRGPAFNIHLITPGPCPDLFLHVAAQASAPPNPRCSS